MEEVYNVFQFAAYVMSAIALVCIGVMIFFMKIVAPTWAVIRRWFDLPKVEMAVVGLFAIGLIQYGATKESVRSTFTFSKGIIDNENTPSYSTNDTVFISWQKSKTTIVITNGTPIHIEYRLATNDVEFVELTTVAFENMSWTGTVEGATNYNYNIWYDYQGESQYVIDDQWEYHTTRAKNKDVIAINGKIQGEDKSLDAPVDLMTSRTNAWEVMQNELEAKQ